MEGGFKVSPVHLGGDATAEVRTATSRRNRGRSTSQRSALTLPPRHPHRAPSGQLWGSPLYKWPEHKRDRFEWWCRRMGRALELYDETRIDHFRGFAGEQVALQVGCFCPVLLWCGMPTRHALCTAHLAHLYCCTAGYWSVDAKAETAMGGSWKKGPGLELFNAIKVWGGAKAS